MGYRFSLESANTVANLAFGRVYACYRDIFDSQESYWNFRGFLEQYPERFYSLNNDKYSRFKRVLYTLDKYASCIFRDHNEDTVEPYIHRSVLNSLQILSNLFCKCTIKALLLPSVSNDKHHFMTSKELLKELVYIHPNNSCLILQPEAPPLKITIFDAFPNFEVALRQVDEWPAVLFWEDEENYAFIPVQKKYELFELFEIIKYDRHPIHELIRIAETKRHACHYIFHLSDLHFGAKGVYTAKRRLMSLIEAKLSHFDFEDNVQFLVTGDAVDSPIPIAESEYDEFSDFLYRISSHKTIRVLGNHDINYKGLALTHKNQHIAHSIGKYPCVEILENPKVIFLLFNSNTNGSLAEGEIGIQQMSEMGNHLDKIHNLNDYLLIAVLHHHIIPIPKPDYYDKKWYEKIIPISIMEGTLHLKDAELFIQWLKKRNVKIVLHGHKHIPFIGNVEGMQVIGCGSSTGRITHKEKGKTYISYNLLKITDHEIVFTQFAEDIMGSGESINTRTVSY